MHNKWIGNIGLKINVCMKVSLKKNNKIKVNRKALTILFRNVNGHYTHITLSHH